MLTRTNTHGRQAGFTLIELMVTLVIAAIVLSIAVPSYQQQIRKSRRTDARNAVLDLAAREERYLSTANVYSVTPSDLGYTGAWPITVGSGYYQVSVGNVNAPNPAAVPPTVATFTVTATAIGTQLNDTTCRTFSVDQTGQQSSTTSGGALSVGTASTCWN